MKSNAFLFYAKSNAFFKCIGFHDKMENALYLAMGGGGGGGGGEVRIKVMRTRVYLKAAAEDKTKTYHIYWNVVVTSMEKKHNQFRKNTFSCHKT